MYLSERLQKLDIYQKDQTSVSLNLFHVYSVKFDKAPSCPALSMLSHKIETHFKTSSGKFESILYKNSVEPCVTPRWM